MEALLSLGLLSAFGILIIGFLRTTLPLASHLLGRVIYRKGIPPARPFIVDEGREIVMKEDTPTGR